MKLIILKLVILNKGYKDFIYLGSIISKEKEDLVSFWNLRLVKCI